MKTLIVYESFFGNTEKIAQALAQGAGAKAVKVQEMTGGLPADLELLIVGSPTRGFQPSPMINVFCKTLPKGRLKGIKVAAFDTRIDLETIKSKVFRWVVDKGGYAGKTILKHLVKNGGVEAAPPEGFYVTDEKGPLKEGETERAKSWVKTIA